ncbi:transcription termination factor Rho [Candidatus Vidania fulgoroideorum]
MKGILEITSKKGGYIRKRKNRYFSKKKDLFLSIKEIKTKKLKNGDYLNFVKKKNFLEIKKINGIDFNNINKRRKFKNLNPIHPNKQIFLSKGFEKNISNRIIDIITPIGKGQRGLIVASPKSGKTIMLKNIGISIEKNYPNIELIVLLIDERPEEVTEIKNSFKSEIYYSNFDESPYRHIHISELVLEKAKRSVELGKDVVILLDSITRLARSYNIISPNSGKILSGGIDSNALIRPKRFFGSARNTKFGTLTILGTVLVNTGSKMDDVIYEEFKGTGNMEIYLEKKMVHKNIFPAISIKKSGTRREEFIINRNLNKVLILKKMLLKLNSIDSIEYLIDKIKKTKNNKELLNIIRSKRDLNSRSLV